MMEVTTAHIISGLIGGLIRAIVGITKDQTFTPEKFKMSWRIALLVGYAGTDFLENLYKLRFAQFFKI